MGTDVWVCLSVCFKKAWLKSPITRAEFLDSEELSTRLTVLLLIPAPGSWGKDQEFEGSLSYTVRRRLAASTSDCLRREES